MPERAQDSPGNGPVYGLKSPDWLASYDPATSSWRTCQHCLVEGLTVYSETWPRSGMTRNGTAYQLPPLARPTGGIESGSWPTPDASVVQYGEKPDTWLARRERVKLTALNGNGMGMPLTIAVHLWPTPTSRDWRSEKCSPEVFAERDAHTRGKTLPWEIGGSLNPTWVEWLMGFPAEWTALDASEMPSSRKSQKSSGEP